MSRLSFSPSALTLGTAQIGLTYGIANKRGQPDEAEATAILDLALLNNVTVFDTARAYGTSEVRIGRWRSKRGASQVRIVSKVPPVPSGTAGVRRTFAREQLTASLKALKTDKLDLLLMHKGDDLLDEAIVEELQEATAEGKIGGFGASLYDPRIGVQLLDRVPLAAIQIPASVVDKRFERMDVLKQAQNSGVTVFVRSVMLQGALLMTPERLPSHLAALAKPLALIRQLSEKSGRPVAEILLVYARDLPGTHSVVVGVELAAQLQTHLAAIASPPLKSDEREWLAERIGDVPDTVVDPSSWPKQ